MGLLDFNFEDPRNLGLLRAGAGMMAQAGDTSKPFGMGQAIAYGMDTYANTLEADKKRKLEEQLAQQKIFETQENNQYTRNLRQAQQEELQQKTAGMLAKQNTIKEMQAKFAKDPNYTPTAFERLALGETGVFSQKNRYFEPMLVKNNEGKYVYVQPSTGGETKEFAYNPVGNFKYVRGVGLTPDMRVDLLTNEAERVKLNESPTSKATGNAPPLPTLPSFGQPATQPTISGNSAFNIPLPSGLPPELQSTQTMPEQPQGKPSGIFRTQPEKPMPSQMQKELILSDQAAQASKSVQSTLQEALKLNNKAYSGYFAKGRASLRSNLPGDSESADATIMLDNMMTGQALESLKAIFGSAPTEGERKILLDIQASADKTPKQREQIIKRSIDAAKQRGLEAEATAKAIRGGTYLTQGKTIANEASNTGKVMTMADVQVTALNKKISIDDVIKKAKAAGYEIRGQ